MTALDVLDDTALPSAEEEIWRYSRIDELDRSSFEPTDHAPDIDGPAELLDAVVSSGESAALIDTQPDVFAEMNAALAPPIAIRVPRGTSAAEPIVITHRVAGDRSLSASRLLIEVEEDAEITVIERFVSDAASSNTAALFLPLVQIVAAPAARVQYLATNQLASDVWSIGHQQTIGERDSSMTIASVALGGYYARTRTEARLVGQGSSTRQVALYFAGDDQMHDFRTIQDHAAPHTTSDLLFKGAVQDRSRSVYTGLIKIRENAAGSTAYQTNRNLTLSEGAWAQSVPNLDIETNDVKCSHASTVGPIDSEQQFYLESRGVHPDTAARLVVLGFFDEVIGQLPGGRLRTELRRSVADKLQIGADARGGTR